MAGTWVVADTRDGAFRRVVFEMLSEGRNVAACLGEELVAVLLGQDVAGFAPRLAEHGADRIIVLEDPALATYTTDAYASALTTLIGRHEPSAVLFAASAVGLDLAPVVAQRLGTGLVTDVTRILCDDGLRFERPTYSGRVLATITFAPDARPMLATVRPTAFSVVPPTVGRTAPITVERVAGFGDVRQVVARVVTATSGRADLSEADYVVAGGRGMRGPEGFAALERLADVLGASIGASRAAVDAGWINPQLQIGQTGKVVAPRLYIGFGISGATQHLAGITGSKCIVAVNRDPGADIFKVADYGIVGDLFDVIPLMTEGFRSLLASA